MRYGFLHRPTPLEARWFEWVFVKGHIEIVIGIVRASYCPESSAPIQQKEKLSTRRNGHDKGVARADITNTRNSIFALVVWEEQNAKPLFEIITVAEQNEVKNER